jgi:hypothetical protein
MPDIVPKVTEALGNARQGVKDAAAAAMTACMQCVNNKDLEQFIPMLIDTMQNPIKVPDCVHKLAATTFVQVSARKQGVYSQKRSCVALQSKACLISTFVEQLLQLLLCVRACFLSTVTVHGNFPASQPATGLSQCAAALHVS